MRMGSLYAVTSCCVGFNVSIYNDTKSHTNLSIVINKSQSQLHCYHPQRSCGKVIFSQASVILSTGVCLPAIPGQTSPWQADNTAPPPRDGYCSGRYASYWNAFLCEHIFRLSHLFVGRKQMCLMHFCGVSYNNQL